MTCLCGQPLTGEPYEHPRWGASDSKLRYACQCGRVVYAYDAQQAREEMERDDHPHRDAVGRRA
jgi:hypothetical protein